MENIKKAPPEAATSKSAKEKHNQENLTTAQGRKQGNFEAGTSLEMVGIDLRHTRLFCGFLTEQLEREAQQGFTAGRAQVYAACLYVLEDRLRTLEDVANSEAAHFYGK